MRRCHGSLTSLTSLSSHISHNSNTSINSRTKIFNNTNIQQQIANIEDDIIKICNDYHYFTDKFDKKINNIVNRYEGRTNKLFIDLRHRETECKKLNIKIEHIWKELKNINNTNNTTNIKDIKDTNNTKYMHYQSYQPNLKEVDRLSNNILFVLCLYTLFVISMVITY